MGESFGWAGKILRVDLSTGEVKKQPFPVDWQDKLLGGRNVNSKILFDEVPPGTDPLSPRNLLIIGTGPLTGVIGPGTGRFTVTAKSPLTGIHGDANSGGDFGPELKYAGYDHLVISGKAARPVYLMIDDDRIQIRDAFALWGKTVPDADKMIRADIGDPGVKTLVIGPAGENRVRFACPIANLYRAPGRVGMGAVMGSKNLKAIVARGSRPVRIARHQEYLTVLDELFRAIFKTAVYPVWSKYGTSVLIGPKQMRGEIGVRNNQETYWTDEKVSELSSEAFVDRHVVKSKACFSCPMHCSHGFVIKDGPYAGTYAEGMEWSTIGCFGGHLDNPRLDAIGKCHQLCSQYGLDTMSTGLMIAFAMELYQRKILTREDTGGIALEWGDHRVIVELVHQIARREGIGNLLADGKRLLVQKLGRRGLDAERYANHVKWLDEVTDFRSDLGRALNYAVATRGADHLRGLPTIAVWREGNYQKLFGKNHWEKMFRSKKAIDVQAYDPVRADTVIYNETICGAADAVGICKFNTEWVLQELVGLQAMAGLASLVTGRDIDAEKLGLIVERGWQIERAFCVREGIRAADDLPSARYFEPIPFGPQKGKKLDRRRFKKLLLEYYRKRGWDQQGIPTRKRLEALDLGDVADKISA